ncbi:MAG: CHAP domain-containing protein [Candidatus Nomurabacteria bacterium]|jgi:surface antigen|nr:CHAP domain-containing protein [Candidatus Nomurabacteria bacterium]
MGKQTASVRAQNTNKLKRIGLSAIALLMVVGLVTQYNFAVVRADHFDDQINAIQKEVDEYNRRAAELGAQADTLQNKVNELNNQAATIQAQIDLSQARHDKLVEQIEKTKKEIAETEDTLGYIVVDKAMSSKITPIERLASSGNLAKYIDEETQRNALSDSLADMVTQIENLQKQLNKQKKEVEQILADQKAQKEALVAKRAEQQELLDKTKGDENTYRNLVNSNNARINELRAAQRAANASKGGTVQSGDPNKGGYPAYLANACQDCIVDPWGMYNRECVSYAAWKVHQTYGNMPYWGGRGNANQWASSARADGFTVSSVPKAKTVGFWYAGYYGHVVWVEQVDGNRLYVSQYNYDWNGNYSEMWIDASAFDGFIYFGG